MMANRSTTARVASHAAPAPVAPDPTNVRAGIARATIPFDHVGERPASIAYEAQGPATAPATVVLGGISAGRHLAPTASDPSPGWWPGVVGEAAALDPTRHLLVGIDYLGGNSEDGLLRPVTSHDQARAIAVVLDELGIAVASITGASYGGMVGWPSPNYSRRGWRGSPSSARPTAPTPWRRPSARFNVRSSSWGSRPGRRPRPRAGPRSRDDQLPELARIRGAVRIPPA